MEKININDNIQMICYEQNERKKDDYDIEKSIIINNHYEVIFASRRNKSGKEEFVSWNHNLNNDSFGIHYYNGHYFDEYKKAYKDFYLRTETIESMELGTRTIAESYFKTTEP